MFNVYTSLFSFLCLIILFVFYTAVQFVLLLHRIGYYTICFIHVCYLISINYEYECESYTKVEKK